jgi:hypothetical protein
MGIPSLGLPKGKVAPGVDYQGGLREPDENGKLHRGFVFIPPTERPSKVDGEVQPYEAEVLGDIPDADEYAALRTAITTARRKAIASGSRSRSGSGSGGRLKPSEHRDACLSAGPGEQRDALLKIILEWQFRDYELEDIFNLFIQLVSEMECYKPEDPWYPANGDNPEAWFRDLLKEVGTFVPDARPGELDGIHSPMRPGLLNGIKTGEWLSRQKFDTLVMAIPGIVPAGVVVMAGAPFSGKSLLGHRFCLECARGGEVFGMKVAARDSLYLALEDGDRRIQERSRELLGGEKSLPAGFHYATEVDKGKLIPVVTEWLRGHPDGIVVIDTLGKVMEKPQKGETTYDRDYRILGELKNLSALYPECTIIVNHHSRKAKADDFVDLVSGTNAITGGADTVLLVDRKRGQKEGVLRIVSRDLDDAAYAMILERPLGWRLDGDDLEDAGSRVVPGGTDSLGPVSTAVVEYVSSHSEGVTRDQVASALDMTPGDATTYLYRNTESGRIVRIRRGVYGPANSGRITINTPDGAKDGGFLRTV